MKKIVSLVLALSMVLSMFATVFAATLSDIEGTKYEGAVEALVELGVVNGYPTGDYKPENKVNRAELAKMIVICMGLEEDADRAQYQTSFADDSLTEGGNFAWARGYVNAAAAAGVIKGYPDGTFGPERTVTYAEAVTMMLRALGYGNVMEAEGTWPTNAMMKAKELELFDNVEFNSSNDGATRGDVAILLWNMLRTPMWKITAENQGTGMTSNMDKLMLNVKFPKYAYVEDYYLLDVEVENDEVTVAIVSAEDYEDGYYGNALEGEYLGADLSKLVPGMKVSALYNRKAEEFLTIACEDTMAEGMVENPANSSYDIRVGEKDYKFSEGRKVTADSGAGELPYLVVATEGKYITALRELPSEGELVEKATTTQRKVGEDAIVIIDGERATNEDIEEGDYIVKVTAFGDPYYEVARERIEGTFESLKWEADEEKGILTIEVDGEEYEAIYRILKDNVFEGEDNDKEVDIEELLVTKKADNKYLDQDVELVLNYLGQVVRVHFGEVDDLEAAGNFYVLTSDGTWHESSKSGMTYYVGLAGADGDDSYTLAKKALVEEIPEDYFAGMATKDADGVEIPEEEVDDPLFYFVKFNDDDEIKSLELLEAGNKKYGDYSLVAFDEEIDDDGYLAGYKVTNSTVVFTATPVLDADGQVESVELETSKGKDALDGVTEGLVAYKTTGTTPKAVYVFVTEDAKSTELQFGKVTKYQVRSGVLSLYIDGEKMIVDEDEYDDIETAENAARKLVGCMIAYTENEAGISVAAVLTTSDLDNEVAGLVTEVEDSWLTYNEDGTPTTIDTEAEDVVDGFEDYTFVLCEASIDKNNNVVFEEGAEVLGEGINADIFKKNDRLVVNEENKLVVIIRGLDNDDVIDDGELILG